MSKIFSIILLSLVFLSGCSINIELDKENTQNPGKTLQRESDDFEERVYNWEGRIKEIKKHDNKDGYSVIVWDGQFSGGSFMVEDFLVNKHNLIPGDFIHVVVKDTYDGLEILDMQKIQGYSSVKGIIQEINIEGDAPYILLKASNKDIFNEIIKVIIDEDTRFKNTIPEGLNYGDIIIAKGILTDSNMKCKEITLISQLKIH